MIAVARGAKKLSHIGTRGEAHMVDVSAKPATARVAVAEGRVLMTAKTLNIVREGNAKVDSARGVLKLVSFDNAQQLQKDGSGTFAAVGGAQPQPTKTATIVQGAVEKSNVRGVVEMSRMIEITRNYEQIAAILKQQHDLSPSSVDKLAEVPN